MEGYIGIPFLSRSQFLDIAVITKSHIVLHNRIIRLEKNELCFAEVTCVLASLFGIYMISRIYICKYL